MIHQFNLHFVLSTIPRDCSAYSNEGYSNFIKENCQEWVRHRNLFFMIIGVELAKNAILISHRIEGAPMMFSERNRPAFVGYTKDFVQSTKRRIHGMDREKSGNAGRPTPLVLRGLLQLDFNS